MARAPASGRRLSEADASLVKGMVRRGDRHHDIAAWFGVNQGRIAEVIGGDLHPNARPTHANQLPPPGPYSSGRAAHRAVTALEEAKTAHDQAKETVDEALNEIRRGRL
jgi:hypothetical protein